MLTEADITEALRVCYDPGLQINIVDLGRVYALTIEQATDVPGPDPRVRVGVTLLPRDEAADPLLAAQIVNRLYGLRDVAHAEVAFTTEPWTPARMNAAARSERSHQQGLVQLGPATPGRLRTR